MAGSAKSANGVCVRAALRRRGFFEPCVECNRVALRGCGFVRCERCKGSRGFEFKVNNGRGMSSEPVRHVWTSEVDWSSTVSAICFYQYW